MPKGTASCNSLINLWYRAVAWANIADNASAAPFTNVYVRLATASYAASDTADADEATFTNYAGGVAVARTAGGWDAAAGGATANTAAFEYPQCGASGNTITSACTTSAATGATAIWHYGDLNAPIAVSNTIVIRFAAGAATVTEA